jgi:hypothetical protein
MLHPAMRVLVIWKRPPLKTLQLKIHKPRNLPAGNVAALQPYHDFQRVSRLPIGEFVSKFNGVVFRPAKNNLQMSRYAIHVRGRREVCAGCTASMLDHGPIARDRAPA